MSALREIAAMDLTHQDHGAGRGAGHQSGFGVPRGQLAGIDDMQTIDVLFRQDGLDDGLGIEMLRQGKLDEHAVDLGIGIEFRHQRHQGFLRGLLGQRVLHRLEAALLGHAALGADIGVAGRIITDNHHRETGPATRFAFQNRRCLCDGLDYRSRCLLAINHRCHDRIPRSRFSGTITAASGRQ